MEKRICWYAVFLDELLDLINFVRSAYMVDFKVQGVIQGSVSSLHVH